MVVAMMVVSFPLGFYLTINTTNTVKCPGSRCHHTYLFTTFPPTILVEMYKIIGICIYLARLNYKILIKELDSNNFFSWKQQPSRIFFNSSSRPCCSFYRHHHPINSLPVSYLSLRNATYVISAWMWFNDTGNSQGHTQTKSTLSPSPTGWDGVESEFISPRDFTISQVHHPTRDQPWQRINVQHNSRTHRAWEITATNHPIRSGG